MLPYSGIKIQHRQVKLSDLPDAMPKPSPKASPLVLQLDNGAVLEESLDIKTAKTRWANTIFTLYSDS